MKILFVHPATEMSIGDVARGYRSALERQGHEIADYRLAQRLEYHKKAIPPERTNVAVLAHAASENILNEAIYHEAELVLIVSGLNVHPIALWLLGKVGIPAAVVLTESPYDDEPQKQWADLSGTRANLKMTVFTNDRFSAMKYGWNFLPPCFDPMVHHPVDSVDEHVCDVLMVGTGWVERQEFLEAVDWTGIDLRLYGIWPNVTPESPLNQFYRPAVVSNQHINELYCSARININIHRGSEVALTPGPRVYELAACGAFQISDPREDLVELFRGNVPTFSSPQELGEKIRYYLQNEEERKFLAAGALDAVCDEDFDKRAAQLTSIIGHELSVGTT